VVRLFNRFAWLVAGGLVVACFSVAGPVTAGASQLLGTIAPIVTVTPNPSPATTGSVDYQVVVSDPTDFGTPTGSVSVSDGALGSCPISSLDDTGPEYTGSGDCSIEEPAGSYTITATYSGDSNYASAQGTASETVNAATPTVTVTLESGATTGDVSYGVNVAGPAGAVTPTGYVIVSDGTNQCTVSSLDGSGAGSCPIGEGAGTYSINATYYGDNNYTTAQGSGHETVLQATPTLHPGGTTGAVTGNVTFSVSVAGTGGPAPTGTVTVGELPSGSPNCTITLVSGAGSCQLYLTPSTYTIKFSYSGDSNYLKADTGNTFHQTVYPAPVTVGVTAKNPDAASISGTASVKYTVTVTGLSGLPNPTGSVVVGDGNGGSCTIVKLKASGVGSCSITESLGTYSVSASYSGDGNYASSSGSLTESVGTKTATGLGVAGSPVAPGGSVTLTATVSSDAAGATTPQGQVTFVIGGVPQAPVSLSDGVATLVYPVSSGSAKGKVTVKAEFESSDANTWFNSNKSGSFKVS
jgi:hypothetical protein